MAGSPETRYARSGEVSIAYQVIGDGPRDLVVVPGIISHVEFFHELPGYTEFLEGLARFARVIVFDKRGNGLSDRISGTPTLEDRMDDIGAVMDAVSSRRASLLAISEGGPISLLFAATHPDRVEHLVLYETFVRYGGVSDHPIGMMPDAHRELTELMVDNWGTGFSLIGFGTSQVEDARVRELWGRAERLSDSPGGFRTLFELLADIDVRSALPSVQAPCLVIHGGDTSMFTAHGEHLADHLPDARLTVIDGVDHFPWFADGHRVAGEIEEFLTGARSPVVPDRVLATVLFIDIVGSTEHAVAQGDRRWTHTLERFYELARRELTRFRGLEANTTGDGLVARFDGPARAVAAACAIRDGVEDLGLAVRAGLHTGEIELLGDDIGGIAVHVASRVMGRAGSGDVMTSSTVKDLVVGSGIVFDDLDVHELKGVPGSWGLYRVVT